MKNKENPQRTPRYRSSMFPSPREDIDWRKCRSRSALTFPSKRFRKHRRNREVVQVLKVNNGGRYGEEVTSRRREKGVLYSLSQRNMTVGDLTGRIIRHRAFVEKCEPGIGDGYFVSMPDYQPMERGGGLIYPSQRNKTIGDLTGRIIRH
jgi:hypothetical protein